MNNKKNKLSGFLPTFCMAMVCAFLWGSAFPMIKIGYSCFEIASGDTPSIFLFAGIRFFLAGLLTVLIFSVINKKPLLPTKSSLPKIIVLSLFQTILQYVFFYLGLAFTTGVKASVINGSSTFFALLISAFLFKQETFTAKKAFGCIFGFLGVVLAALSGGVDRSGLSIGDLFILFSAVSYSFSSVFMKKYSASENPAMLSGWQFVLGGAVMTAVGFISGGHLDFSSKKGIAVIIYLAFVSAVAYSLWSIMLKYNNVSRIAVYGSLTPIVGFVLSYIILGEKNGSLLFNMLGLLCVVVGIIAVNYTNKNSQKNTPAD